MEHLKVNGPPGTGKTRLLIDICQREMERGRQPHEIIFCSFTKAAAEEAKSRAIARFGGDRDDYPWFATEHSICFRLLGLNASMVFNNRRLREFGKHYNYAFTGGDDETDSHGRRYQEAMLKSVADHYEFFVNYMRNRMAPFDTAYREFLRLMVYEPPDGFSRDGLQNYIGRRERYKQEHNLWSFDDMIAGALERGLFPPEAKVLIADEMQDSSPLLYELVKRWSTQVESYYIAGDPLQALYTFAGASPYLFYDFPGEDHVLSHSYRLTPGVKDLAQQIIKRTGLPFPEYSASDRHGEIKQRVFKGVDWENAGECFLLARTRWLLSQFAAHFLEKGIPFTSERGKHSPLDTTKGRAFLALAKLRDGERVSNYELASLVRHTSSPYLKHGAKVTVKNLVDGMFGPRDLESMGFTGTFMKAVNNGFEDVLCKNIETYERAYLSKVLARHGRRAFEEPAPLVVTTIHGSKGREKSTVYLSRDLTRKVWNGFCLDRIPESLVYYVGVTRAIDRLVVLAPEHKHLFPLPREVGR